MVLMLSHYPYGPCLPLWPCQELSRLPLGWTGKAVAWPVDTVLDLAHVQVPTAHHPSLGASLKLLAL